MLNLIRWLIDIKEGINEVDEITMINFNYDLYKCITRDDNYQYFIKNTIIHYNNEERISISTIYKNNQFKNNICKEYILIILKKFIYLKQLKLDVNNINCYIIKNIGNNKDKTNITIDIKKILD